MGVKMNLRKLLWMTAVSLVIIPQFIRPARDIVRAAPDQDISKACEVPEKIHEILKRSCYDCHSGETVYPWYSNIQPVGWWLQEHINEGKKELNFSLFGSYSLKKQHHKLNEMIEMVNGGSMPLPSYLWIHRNAKLNADQKKMLVEWFRKIRREIEKRILSKNV